MAGWRLREWREEGRSELFRLSLLRAQRRESADSTMALALAKKTEEAEEEEEATAALGTLLEEEEEVEEESQSLLALMTLALQLMTSLLDPPLRAGDERIVRGCGPPSPDRLPPGEPPPLGPRSLPRVAPFLPFPLPSLLAFGRRVGEEVAPDGRVLGRRDDSPSSSLARWAFDLWTSRAATSSTPPPPRPSNEHRGRRR